MIKIIKLETGTIVFEGLNGKYKRATFLPSVATLWYLGGDAQKFEVHEAGQAVLSFDFSQVGSTQIMPDAAVATTDVDAFITLMEESFFLP